MRRLALLAAAVATAGLAAGAGSAQLVRACAGFQVCVPVSGPWVVVPTGKGSARPKVEYTLTCPRNYIVGGLDAELSQREIDISFGGKLGSPVNPGITTSRQAVFEASYLGTSPRAPTFKPHIGCIPATGGGGRVPTSVTAFRPGEPPARRVRIARVRAGSTTVARGCVARERLVGGAHAFGFFTARPPAASLVGGVSGNRSLAGGRVVVRVRGDAEVGSVRAVVQVQAVCARVR